MSLLKEHMKSAHGMSIITRKVSKHCTVASVSDVAVFAIVRVTLDINIFN